MRILLPLLLMLAGCAMNPGIPEQTLLQGKVLLQSDTLWQGEIIIDGEVTVAYGTTLSIAPGTNIRFVRRDADRDGLGDATIIVKGSLEARGTEIEPIRFLSAETKPRPGDWLEIRSDFARQLKFDWCEFRDSAYTLHAHFTRGHLRNSYIHHNIDGSRLGRSRFLLQYNLIEKNSGKGINFRDSAVTLIDNIIRDNRVGIFLFEKPGESIVSRNNLYRNGINLQLGDFFADDIDLAGNWWGTSDPLQIGQTIYDQDDDEELGRVKTEAASAWHVGAGIQYSAQLKPLWRVSTDGFVDSAPLKVADRIFVASWDGQLRAVDSQGEAIWKTDTGDVIDGSLLAVDGQIFLQNWKRGFYAVDQDNGRLHQLFDYPSSPADDHRQAGPALTDQLLLLPAWNGTLYAIERKSLMLRWQYDAGMPLRATPLTAEGRIYQPSGSNVLSVLDNDGQLLWEKSFAAPLLSSPVLFPDGILLLDKAGTLSAMSIDGTLIWQRNLNQTCFYAAPLVTDSGIFIITTAGTLWRLDLENGQVIWTRSLAESFYATPVISNAGVLVGDNTGMLYLLDPDSGRTLANYKVDEAIQSQVLVTGNRLYFGSRDRNLHSLELIRGGKSE